MNRALVLACVWFSTASCASPEQDVVEEFLKATRERDLAALAGMSMVGFPHLPESWRIDQIAPAEAEPFELDERQRRLNAARAARDARLQEVGSGEDAQLQRIQSRVDRLRVQVEREREEARKSVNTWAPVDGFHGSVDSRRIEITVGTRKGERRYALTLKRYRLSRRPNESELPSRWIVTSIETAKP